MPCNPMFSHRLTSEDLNFADLLTIDEFRGCVESGALIDYDGDGTLVKGDMQDSSGYCVLPSKVDEIPEEVTHILWFNK